MGQRHGPHRVQVDEAHRLLGRGRHEAGKQDVVQLGIAVAHAPGQTGQRREITGRSEQVRGQGADVSVEAMVAADIQRLAQPGQVLGSIVYARAHAHELVVKPVERTMKTRHQATSGARLTLTGHRIEGHAVDVGLQPPQPVLRPKVD